MGPTAVGKTRMALELKESFPQIEVISADSRQIFRLMNIGTAKPSPAELSVLPHHFIDIKNPDENINAGEFGVAGRDMYRQLRKQQKIPIVVGGSGLYIRSLIDGLFQGRVSDPEVKSMLQQRADKEGLAGLFAEMMKIDPEAAPKIHPNDRQRIVRALEVWRVTGQSVSQLRKKLHPKIDLTPVFIGLNREREKLYQIINARVGRMITDGLIEEVQRMRMHGYNRKLQSQKTVGYQEIHDYLDKNISLPEAVELIKRNTRRFAKRQLTWFNRDERITWFKIDDESGWRKAKEELTVAIEKYLADFVA